MNYTSDYYTNAKALALVEVVDKATTTYRIINCAHIISKHSVMKLELPVVAIFDDGIVRLGIIKSISDRLTRLLITKIDFECEYDLKMSKPLDISAEMDPIRRFQLLAARKRINAINRNAMRITNNPINCNEQKAHYN